MEGEYFGTDHPNCAMLNIEVPGPYYGHYPISFPRFKRALVGAWIKEFGRRCPHCSRTMIFAPIMRKSHDNRATIDHIHARGLGGSGHLSNLRFICHGCNRDKSKLEAERAQKMHAEYAALIGRAVALFRERRAAAHKS